MVDLSITRTRTWVAVGAIGSVVAAVLTVAVAGRSGPIWFDTTLTDWSVRHRTGWLDTVMEALTRLGNPGWTMVVVVVVAFVAVLARRANLAALIVVSSTVGNVLNPYLKDAVGRPRPPRALWLIDVRGSSFPSGHALASVTCWVAAAVVFAMLVEGRGRRFLVMGAGLVVAKVVGASRIYLGVHWSTDVAAGWAWGAVVLAAAVLVTVVAPRAMRDRRRTEEVRADTAAPEPAHGDP